MDRLPSGPLTLIASFLEIRDVNSMCLLCHRINEDVRSMKKHWFVQYHQKHGKRKLERWNHKGPYIVACIPHGNEYRRMRRLLGGVAVPIPPSHDFRCTNLEHHNRIVPCMFSRDAEVDWKRKLAHQNFLKKKRFLWNPKRENKLIRLLKEASELEHDRERFLRAQSHFGV